MTKLTGASTKKRCRIIIDKIIGDDFWPLGQSGVRTSRLTYCLIHYTPCQWGCQNNGKTRSRTTKDELGSSGCTRLEIENR